MVTSFLELRNPPRQWSGSAAPLASLTQREREVLAFLCRRYTDAEIAAALFISPRTVNHHVARILDKLGAVNRREAGAIAASHDLV